MSQLPPKRMCAGICNAEIKSSHCSLCFDKKSHLRKHDDFQHIFEVGKQSFGRGITLWVDKASNAQHRIGVVATKRTFHNAVDRNRAKRLIRESFRLLQPVLDTKPWDIVVIARRAILDQKQQQVQEEMLALFKKQHIAVLEKKNEVACNSSN